MNVTTEDIAYHIANSCEGYADGNLYFSSPDASRDILTINVTDEESGETKTFTMKVFEE